MNPDGKNLKQLTYSDRFSSQAPLSMLIEFSANGTLYFHKHKKQETQIYSSWNPMVQTSTSNKGFGWKKFPILWDTKESHFGSRGGSFRNFTINVDGNRLSNSHSTMRRMMAPKYTPDGKYIVFSSDVNGSGSPRNRDLYIMDALTGKNLRRLTYGMDNRFFAFNFPDGKRIVFPVVQRIMLETFSSWTLTEQLETNYKCYWERIRIFSAARLASIQWCNHSSVVARWQGNSVCR